MKRAQLVAPALPKETIQVKIVEREWGIERCYKSRDGQEQCIPASFDTWQFST